MTRTLTIGVFTDRDDAEKAINALREAGVPDGNISFVYTNPQGEVEAQTAEEAVETHTTVGENAASGATTGGIIGAVAGLVAAAGILPGLGALFVAGPLAAALGLTGAAATTVAGAATGALAGGLLGALTGLGVTEEQARLYEEEVRAGRILVAAESDTGSMLQHFAAHDAREAREYSVERP